jgi:hypothetical protein
VNAFLYLHSLVAVLYQKRLKKERKARRRLQDQLELEMKRRQQLEEALKNSGAPPEALRILNGKKPLSNTRVYGWIKPLIIQLRR